MPAAIPAALEHRISVVTRPGAAYPADPPFHPAVAYPEYPFPALGLAPANDAYAMVRAALKDLGFDAAHYDTPRWNPLGDFIRPGMRVLVKPNLVQDRHYKGGDVVCLDTHGAVVRAVMDYVILALGGQGTLTLADAPVLSTVFAKALAVAQVEPVIRFYQAHAQPLLQVKDFRMITGELDDRFHVIGWRDLPGDPAGTVTFDLGANSLLAPVGHLAHLFRIPHYRQGDTAPYHDRDIHRYVIPRTVVDADVIINLPKMKTHCKAGMTAALKNFVGIVARRHCYANYRQGGPEHSGDQYPRAGLIPALSEKLERAIDGRGDPASRAAFSFLFRGNEFLRKHLGMDSIRDGGWYGNDTVWRAMLDLNRIARYGQPDGCMADTPQRTIFTLTEGIVAGEGEGPLEARAKPAGCLVAGLNPVAADMVTATVMGFDYLKIPSVREAAALDRWPLFHGAADDLRAVVAGRELGLAGLAREKICPPFEPPYGWRGHIEARAGA